jgi:chromosome segregation ATPase
VLTLVYHLYALLRSFGMIWSPDSPGAASGTAMRRRLRSELIAQVQTEAYELLGEGLNPTVRAIRARIGGSTNEVSAALAEWRKAIKSKLDGAITERGFPEYVAEYVRVGIRTAELLRTREEANGAHSVEALAQKNAALEASVSVLEHERKELRDWIGRLEGELTSARRLADDREQARAAFTTALAAADALRVELTEARARAGRVKGLEQQLDDAREALGRAREEVAEVRETAAALRASLEEARARATRVGLLEQQLEEVREALGKARGEIETLVSSAGRRAAPKRASRRAPKRPPRSPRPPARAGRPRRKSARVAPVAKRPKQAARKRTKAVGARARSARKLPRRGSKR